MPRSTKFAQPTPEPSAAGGFSLIELLVVIAIILIVPQLARARITANEAAARETVRTITTASMAYSSTWGNGYPPTLAALGGSSVVATCNLALHSDILSKCTRGLALSRAPTPVRCFVRH